MLKDVYGVDKHILYKLTKTVEVLPRGEDGSEGGVEPFPITWYNGKEDHDKN